MNRKGFSLLEAILVITVMSIVLGAAAPNIVRGILAKYGAKTALDMTAIEEAARAYIIDTKSWPTSISDLTAGGKYLPATWTGQSPFNKPYTISSTSALLTVSTVVQEGSQKAVTNDLPASTISGTTVTSSIGTPASAAGIPVGSIIPWPSNAVPSGWFLCNGQAVKRATYPDLFTAIGTTYGAGDGSTTFNVPDLRDRTVVGQDNMGGAGTTNRITQWGSSPSTIGGTFGEDAHRQTVAEMAPHTHSYRWWNAWYFSGSTELAAKGSYNDNAQTSSTGGNGDGTGKGAPSNVVQPSMALGYIIKAQ